jgi:WD repeat-containing protein 35
MEMLMRLISCVSSGYVAASYGVVYSAVSWEGGGLRLALAVDAYIYLANIRPEYKWAFSGNSTCVYEFKKKDRGEHSVMFWDIRTCER